MDKTDMDVVFMRQSIDLLRRKLGEIYPPGEIIGFTRMIFESLCGYTPTDTLLHG